jgi:ferritin-like protein
VEISERELRAMVAGIDDQHRAAMSTFTEDNRALIFETGPSRRKFLAGLGAGGAALVIGSAVMPVGRLVPRAWSQTAPSDGDIATFAASVEYAAVAAYQAAAKSGKVTNKAILDAATAFAGQHQQHGDAFKAAGTNKNVMANKGVLDMVTPQLTAAKTENDVVALAYGLENAAAATYIFALGVLTTEGAYNAVASVMPVEAQHAVALGLVLGKPLDEKGFLPSFETKDGALDPAKFPAA